MRDIAWRDQHMLRAIIDHMPVALSVKRASDFQYILVNHEYARLLGLRAEDAIGKTDHDLVPADCVEAWRRGDEQVVQSRAPAQIPAVALSSPALGLRTVRILKAPLFDSVGEVTLVIGILEDITDRQHFERTLAENTPVALMPEDAVLLNSAREQLHRLAARMSEAQETERRRLAIELHDRVGQNLTALGINLNIVRSLLPQDQMARLGPKLDTAMSLLEETIERIRDLNSDLRPPVLDDYGLLAALRWFCQRFTERTGLETVVEGREPDPRLEQMADIGLFRIAQEALTNAAKHARARSVVVRYEEDGGVVRLTIADDGVGFDPSTYRSSERRAGWGLIGMQERAAAVGGQLRIESKPGAGTRVLVSIPR